MARRSSSGTNTVPRLVVKIIGSKQVKQFIQEPQEDAPDASEREAGNPEAEAAGDFDFEKRPEKRVVPSSRSQTQQQTRADSALWAVINQVPDRVCVTAPSGDRSGSYIHPKTRQVTERRAAGAPETTQQRGASEDRDEAELSSAVRAELSDRRLRSLRPTEDEVGSCSGTVDRSEITHLFLRNDVPLKLPTFSLLLQIFADETDPAQINYRNLLQFIKASAFPAEELHGDGELQCG